MLTLLMIALEPAVLADPMKWLIELDQVGPARALPEYPWPSVALMHLPMRLGIPTIVHYYAVVIAFMLVVDAVMAWLLWRSGGSRMGPGLQVWLLYAPALGPLIFTRFDVLPAALVAAALLGLSAGRAASSGALAGLGAGFKLWPAAAFPALLVPMEWRTRLRALASITGAGLALAVATAAAAGWGRLWSPLASQAERGLQLEAFAALPLLWARYLDASGGWSVRYAECKCHEIFGPGVPAAIHGGTYALIFGSIAVLALHARAFAAPRERRTAAVSAMLTALIVIAWLIGGRVFSPQYLIWLTAPVAALGALPGRQLPPADVALIVLIALLTHVVFPYGYESLISEPDGRQALFLAAMTIRDALIAALAVRLAARLWHATTPENA
ncbi:MAG TPA: glycosyltransferase 87 family protein [Burkholderiales bacterium]|nr:glycosyltransferase 87 family protein [Burkholderiales bacterium]